MTQDLAADQQHFDAAWEAREASRHSLAKAGQAAGGPRASARIVAQKAKEYADGLGAPDEAVAFGRIDDDEELTYIGKHAILDAEKNSLVVSWQSKAAIPYYSATLLAPMGLLRKRSFDTKGNAVLSFEETVFADLAERVKSLTANEQLGIDDALLSDLDKDRSTEMRDIVQTIHGTQFHLMRRSLDELLVIQGGPGTGKTAVALHRASWLLYNHRDELDGTDVLVVGPNPAFTQYIHNVLPSLGDRMVKHRNLVALGPQASTGRAEPDDTARLKGELRMAGLRKAALRARIRPPRDVVRINTTMGPRPISAKSIADAMAKLHGVPYASGRNSLRTLLESAVRASVGRPSPEASSLDNALERIWPSLTAARFVQELLGSRQRLSDAAGDGFTARDVERLYRAAATNLGTEEWSDADVALIDEADFLIQGSRRGASHIVVDEAQDLSPMQLRSLKRRSSNGSYTLVGDVAQSTGRWARDSWDDILDALKTDGVPHHLANLEYGYRVPREVYEVAEPLLPLIAPDIKAPRIIRDAPSAPVLQWAEPDGVVTLAVEQAQSHAAKGRFVGLIVPDALLEAAATAFREADVNYKLVSSGGLGQSINLLSATESKGLEFDAIVVVEPAQIGRQNSHGLRHLYIALTRTTKYLSVVYSEAMAEIGLVVGQPKVEPVASLAPAVQAEPSVDAPVAESPAALAPEPSVARVLAAPRPASQRLIDAYADEVAADVHGALTPQMHAPFIEALASLLGLSIVVNGENRDG